MKAFHHADAPGADGSFDELVVATYDDEDDEMFAPQRVERDSIPFRYVWPSELDLMAELAGMRPRGRWGGWHGEAFTSESRAHVSIWEQPQARIG